jgi:NitT/TauT family transport system substrate-binding protein
MSTSTGLKKIRIAAMNPVHDLAVLVAHDEGLFQQEGLDVEILKTPGTGTLDGDPQGLEKGVFDRAMWSPFNTGEVDQYRMCEWGVVKRTVEATSNNQRPGKIVALGAAMSKMAIVTGPQSCIYEPEQLKNTPVAVSTFNGSHFTTLKMLEGFIKKEDIQTTSGGTMIERLEAIKKGEVAAGNFYEPWISVAQKQGFRVLMESHSTRSEAAGDQLDGPTLAAMFRAEVASAELINSDTQRYTSYFIEEVQGLLEPQDFQHWRLLYAPPVPYTRERFNDTYNWMLGYPELVEAGATYEQVVDNRAWE